MQVLQPLAALPQQQPHFAAPAPFMQQPQPGGYVAQQAAPPGVVLLPGGSIQQQALTAPIVLQPGQVYFPQQQQQFAAPQLAQQQLQYAGPAVQFLGGGYRA